MMLNSNLTDEQKEKILYDYRKMVVGDKWDKGKWNDLNVLQRTLKYEIEGYGDVERNKKVMQEAFSLYCNNYDEKYKTSDIMNGWWYCFKTLLNFKNRRDKDKFSCMYNNIENAKGKSMVDFLKEKLSRRYKNEGKYNQEEICKALLRFLMVAYTIGNMTPAPINPKANYLDNWEYKLKLHKEKYHDYNGDISKLYFQDYCEENGEIKKFVTLAQFRHNPAEYINDRVKLIIRRGCRIVGVSDGDLDNEVNTIFNDLLK